MVTPSNGGKSFTTAVAEIAFPNIPPADSNSNSIVSPNPPLTTTITNTTGNFFLAPGDSTVTTTCSWDFTTLLSREPGTLSKPGEIGKTATPATRERVGAPPKEDKPTPGSIRPPVPAALSIFFGGPGGGSVAEAIFSVTKIICFSDCTVGDVGSEGQIITVTAAPDATSVFAGWGGSCSGTSTTCSVTLGASNSVIAYFRSKFKTVAAGAYHTCALRPAGDVVCWGRNDEGQIGTGTGTSPTPPLSVTGISMGSGTGTSPTPLPPSSVTGITNAVAIAAGGYHTCALLVGGAVTCWGENDNGQLGNPSSFPASSATPTIVPGITGALAVTAGGAHTCVALAGGSVSCWGLNGDKQLGAKTPLNFSFTPVTVAFGSSLTKQIAAGAYHTCAIVAANSTVLCWGSNSDGQLGNPGGGGLPAAEVQTTDPGCNICPPTVALLNKVTTIAASIGVGNLVSLSPPFGGYHTVALDSSGIDWGWGNNNDGQLVAGAGGGFAKLDPSPPGPTPTKIAAGAYHTCILAGATTGVFCRGNNSDVQSGPTPPGFVPGTTSAVDVAAGGYHTCAVIVTPTTPATGSVACWGRNWEGEVDGTLHGPDVTTPELLTVP